MQNEQIVDFLVQLIHLDIDATRAYGMAIENVDDAEIKRNLESFRKDHERHVRELGALVKKYGGTAPSRPDAKGFLLEGFTAIRSMTGTQGALAAMRRNEQLTTMRYQRAVAHEDLPEDVKTLVHRNFEDERRHLSWIQAHIGIPEPA